MTVHLIYPHGTAISCPDAIGRHLADHLRASYEVRTYDWDEFGVIRPADGDVLLGHPHPTPGTIFRRSIGSKGWSRRLLLSPYHHGDEHQVAHLERWVRRCDEFLAITGAYWFDSIGSGPFSSWAPKMTHLDLAVDRSDFPVIKRGFALPGHRRYLFIGHSGWTKNPAYLDAIASRLPPGSVGWIGRERHAVPHVTAYGTRDFQTEDARNLVAEHDFLLTVGRADANPTTVLEAMAWGLIPVCTKESGYYREDGIINLPLDQPDAAVRILTDLQYLPTQKLLELQHHNWLRIDSHYNWARFGNDVTAAIQCDDSASLRPRTAQDLIRATTRRALSPFALYRREGLRLALGAVMATAHRHPVLKAYSRRN